MCSRFTGVNWEEVVGHYRAAAPDDNALMLEYDGHELFGYDHPNSYIITAMDPTVIIIAEWGLLPSWAKDKKLQNNSLNARIESLKEKPMFRDSINNRCLIPARSFFEHHWTDLSRPKCAKVKYEIKVKNRDLFCFAGLFSVWQGKTTFTIITTEANELMAEVHNHKKRMPVILKPEDELAFLEGAHLENFQFPYQVTLEAVPEHPTEQQMSLF